MSAVPQSMSATSLDRRIQMLRTAMGPLIAAALEDPDVVEVMLNPDRTLWVDRLSSGRAPMGVELPEADGERIIRLVAAHVGAEVHRGQPLLSAELPETGERFEGILPPAAPGLASTITGLPVDCPRPSATMRASASAVPPAGPPTTMRTGLWGHSCACAVNALAPNTVAVVRIHNVRNTLDF